ncbi:MAG: hypothetical protein RIT45_1890 [Pseudomonadota bacterium]
MEPPAPVDSARLGVLWSLRAEVLAGGDAGSVEGQLRAVGFDATTATAVASAAVAAQGEPAARAALVALLDAWIAGALGCHVG